MILEWHTCSAKANFPLFIKLKQLVPNLRFDWPRYSFAQSPHEKEYIDSARFLNFCALDISIISKNLNIQNSCCNQLTRVVCVSVFSKPRHGISTSENIASKTRAGIKKANETTIQFWSLSPPFWNSHVLRFVRLEGSLNSNKQWNENRSATFEPKLKPIAQQYEPVEYCQGKNINVTLP